MKKVLCLTLALLMVVVCLVTGCSTSIGTNGSGNAEAEKSDQSATSVGAQAEGKNTDGAKKKIGLVQINFTNPYYTGASEAFPEAADYFGYELVEQSAENIIEKYIEMGVDMIIADPQDAAALEEVFQRANDAGIPTIALRSPVSTSPYNCLIDHYYGFNGVTYAVCEALGGKGKVLQMQGQIGHEASDSRTKGFEEAISHYPDIEILDSQPCDWDPTKAVAVVENWLTQYDQVDAILSQTDGATPAIVTAVESAGRLNDIKIAGNDGELECLEDMVEGKIMAEAFFSSQRDGYHCMAYADAILRGDKVESTVYLPLYIVCSQEIQSLIKKNVEAEFNMCTPEEAIDKQQNYAQEFQNYYK